MYFPSSVMSTIPTTTWCTTCKSVSHADVIEGRAGCFIQVATANPDGEDNNALTECLENICAHTAANVCACHFTKCRVRN